MHNTTKIDFSSRLLGWYKENKRDLPWRKTEDPYAIWISEIMLQQTQVDTVIPYYERWLSRFPDIHAVAAADLNTVLKHWEGLGYYSRCRNFHKAARMVQEKYNGLVPKNYEDFKTLPGVGHYTAAAVLSMAFQEAIPAVDGNLKRVISRVLGLKRLTKRNLKRIESFLNETISQDRPGDFNQALMDLGSGMCGVKKLGCPHCPLQENCRALSVGNPLEYPQPEKKPPVPHKKLVGGLIWKKGKFLIIRRPEDKLLGGLWEVPGGRIQNGSQPQNYLIQFLKEQFQMDISIGAHAGQVRHAYTHFKITQDFFHCDLGNGGKLEETPDRKWIRPEDIKDYPFPKSNHKLFDQLNQAGWDV